MKSTFQRVLFAAALGTLGAGAVGIAAAQATSSAATSSAPHGQHRWHRHFGGSPLVGSLLRATKQLNLSADQQNQIKTILQSARAGHQGAAQPPGSNVAVLANASDPNHLAAVQAAQSAAASRVQKETALAGAIYDVLLPAQKAQLTTVLNSMQAQQQARRAQWAAQHASGAG